MKLFITIAIILTIVIFSYPSKALINGISGTADECSPCHGSAPDPSSGVEITGIPLTFIPNSTYPLTISLIPLGSSGGFTLVVDRGSFNNQGSGVQLQSSSEVTHSGSSSGTWTVDWMAPGDFTGLVTYKVAGLISNSDGTLNGDLWNFATYTTLGESAVEFKETNLVLNSPANTQYGELAEISATLTDEEGLPLENMSVVFYRQTTFGEIFSGEDITDSDGLATIEHNYSYIPYNFTIVFESVFNGTDNYNKSFATSSTEMVPTYWEEPTASLVSLIAKSMVIIVVGGVWLTYLYVMIQVFHIWKEGRKNIKEDE
jgi:hypothetical protein